MSLLRNVKLNIVLRGPLLFSLSLYAVELLDELIYGVEGAALPLIRDELRLTYVQVGLLLTLPSLLGVCLDPLIGLLGDIWRRKALIVGGAAVTLAAMLLVATGNAFLVLLVGLCLSYPASTAYVSLSQATLMDLNPGREDQTMARWTVLGALGQFAGPALVTLALVLEWGWRPVYLGLALIAGGAAVVFWRQRFNGRRMSSEAEGAAPVRLREIPHAIRQSGVLRWLALVQMADLLLDVFFNFCALYFIDVAGATPVMAGIAVSVLTLGGLLGDALLIPLLEKHDGLRLIRLTASLVLGLYIAFLLAPGVWLKLALLALIGPLRSGWYQVLQGRAYACLPGKSGTVVAAGALVGLFGSAIPVILGTVAERAGLPWAMALMTLGPLSLIVALRAPRRKQPERG